MCEAAVLLLLPSSVGSTGNDDGLKAAKSFYYASELSVIAPTGLVKFIQNFPHKTIQFLLLKVKFGKNPEINFVFKDTG